MGYQKCGPARFISHLDLIRTLGRALRRAGLPIAYSQGFHPLPRLSLGPPLPLGVESTAEYADLVFTETYPGEEIKSRLNTALPLGLKVTEVKAVKEKASSLTSAINQLDYEYLIKIPVNTGSAGDEESLTKCLQKLWVREDLQVPRLKKGVEKVVDIRALWKGYQLSSIKEGLYRLKLEVEYGPAGTIRPEDLLPFLPSACTVERIRRVGALIVRGDDKKTPTGILGT
ncbi:MAG TPA: TIGR03936 family radical SAM-associated protein [Bacillota bacterium]